MTEDNSEFKNFVFGISIVHAVNANWNADFTSYPRTLPDEKGTFFATDKALKYAMRKYWHDILIEPVLLWKEYDAKNLPKGMDDKYKEYKQQNKSGDEFSFVLSHLDVRIFGVTFTETGSNVSLTGPCQITYGTNVYKNSTSYSLQILSPKPSEKGKRQFTVGSEARLTEAHYVYDFSINPNNLFKDELILNLIDQKKDIFLLSKDDVEKLKEAMRLGVNYLTSTPKIGASNSLLLWIEIEPDKEGRVPLIPNLKHLVKIKDDPNKLSLRIVDLTEVISKIDEIISKFKSDANQNNDSTNKLIVEIFYDKSIYSEVECGTPTNIDLLKKHILTGQTFE